jgi:homogentisate 1,2-dioxygenase
MPQGQFFELYQDYICGCVLRVANETFALLPFEKVIVTAVGDVLNTQTGHLEVKPLLSVVIPRSTLGKLDLDAIDPSDSMRNFIYRMDYKRNKGFMVVDRIEASTLNSEN